MEATAQLKNLSVTKDSNSNWPWLVVINEGSCAGLAVAPGCRLKRDAVDLALSLDDLPWNLLELSLYRAAAVDRALVAVLPVDLKLTLSRLARVETELAAHHSLVMDLNDEVIARYGHGGAMELDRRRREIAKDA